MKQKIMCITITEDIDVAHASLEASDYAKLIGFQKVARYMVSTAVSELARNIFRYAKKGKIILKAISKEEEKGIEVIAEDNGPGIPNIGKAMEDRFSTGNSMGMGLPGTKRLMDEFVIEENRPRGTKITIRKWVR